MAYRNRITTSDPRLQTALRNAAKGDGAIQGASAKERGLYSSFARQEGSRLAAGERAGKALSNAEKNRKTQARFNRQNIALRQGDLKLRKDKFDDAKLGTWINLGLGALGTGYNLYSGNQDAKAREKQKQQTAAMTEEWVRRNPAQAVGYYGRHPGVFGLESYITPEILKAASGTPMRRMPR